MYDRVIATGTDAKFFNGCLTLIASTHLHAPDTVVLVYDLGMLPEQLTQLHNLCDVEVIDIGEMGEPPHFKDLYNYAWKTAAVVDAGRRGRLVLWMDAGACLLDSPEDIFSIIQSDGVFLVGTDYRTCEWITMDCMGTMQTSHEELMGRMVIGSVQGYDSSSKFAHLFHEVLEWARNERCIQGPKEQNMGFFHGHLVKGHRHDQTILSVVRRRHGAPAQYNEKRFANWDVRTLNQSTIFLHRLRWHDVSSLRYK